MNTQEKQPAQEGESTLDAQKLQTIELLARGMKAEAVAAKVGSTSRTIRRWKRDPDFAAELRDATGDIRDHVLFNVNPVISRMQDQVDQALNRNKELLDSENSIVANRACGQASTNAIKWIKLFMALERAESGRQVAAATAAIARAAVATAPQASSLQAPDTDSSTPEGNSVPPAPAASSCKNASESGQKRTSGKIVPSVQSQAAPSVKPSVSAPKPMSAPDIVARASTQSESEGERIIAEVAADVVSRRWVRAV
jgi:hypothetical protein